MLTPPQARKAWAAALRSGEHRQCSKTLEQSGTGLRCCLGVVCRLAIQDGVPLRVHDDGYNVSFDGYTGSLPERARRWLGVDSRNPVLNGIRAYARNDQLGQSFAEIADAIDAEWPDDA